MPLSLLTDAMIAFGPVCIFSYLLRNVTLTILFAIVWLTVFHKFISWRLDCVWNVKSIQNRTGKPENPDNLKKFKTFKGYVFWIFLGKDIEEKK
jgi:hypothetical protein